MLWPTVLKVAVRAFLSRVSVAFCTSVVLVVSGADVMAGPVGGVPLAVALLLTTPALRSAWVIVCVPVQVVVAAGASVVAGQVATVSRIASLIAMPVSVTLPMLVTRKL